MHVLWIIYDSCVGALTVFHHLRSVKAKKIVTLKNEMNVTLNVCSQKKKFLNTVIGTVNYF